VHLTRYECREAIEAFTQSRSGSHQQNTAWVLGKVAKAFFELGDYELAVK
jgi:hypothetical protein